MTFFETTSIKKPTKFQILTLGIGSKTKTVHADSCRFPDSHPQKKCHKKGSIAHDATVKSFLSQPHQFTAVLEFYRTEWVRLNAAQQGGGDLFSFFFDVTQKVARNSQSPVIYQKVCVFFSPMNISFFLRKLLTFQEWIINPLVFIFFPIFCTYLEPKWPFVYLDWKKGILFGGFNQKIESYS